MLSDGRIESCSVVSGSGVAHVEMNGGTAVGGVVGWSNGTIWYCKVGDSEFTLYLQTSGTACVGGIVGINNGNGKIVPSGLKGSGVPDILNVRILAMYNVNKSPNGVGGIVGYSNGGNTCITFRNTNTLTTLRVLIDSYADTTGYVGGIIGYSNGATIQADPRGPQITLQLRTNDNHTQQGDLIGNQPDTTVSGITVERIS